MANFFLDNKDLQFHLQHPLMRKIVALKERNYTLKDHHELAPQNFEDAMDNYRRVLEIAGEVCGEVIAPNAEGVDHEGPRVENDHVVYAEGTARNIDAITKAGLSGMTLPYEYDGLNFPLLCDVDRTLSNDCGLMSEQVKDGKTRIRINRSTLLIDENGRLLKVMKGVVAREHVAELLQMLCSK